MVILSDFRYIAIICLIVISIFLLLSCGSPLEPIKPKWVVIDETPGRIDGSHNLVVSGNGDIYIKTGQYTPNEPKIFRYNKEGFTEIARNEYNGGVYMNIGYAANTLWIVAERLGGLSTKQLYISYLICIREGGYYDEIDIPESLNIGVGYWSKMSPVNDDVCWFLSPDSGEIIKYDNGNWFTYPSITPVIGMEYDKQNDVIAAWSQGSENEPAVLWVSSDGGNSWNSRYVRTIGNLCKIGELRNTGSILNGNLYISADVSHNGFVYYASLIKTKICDGNENERFYIGFMHPVGPYYHTPTQLTFHNPTKTGYYCGNITSVYFDGDDWLKEDLDYEIAENFVALKAGSDRCWALVSNSDAFGNRLAYRMYH